MHIRAFYIIIKIPMEIAFYIILGSIFGSFLNMLIYRLPREESILISRSHCINCNHKLGFFDLVPILSYLALLGKCRYCQKKISPRYFLCEIITVIIFTWAGINHGFSFDFFKITFFFSAMLALFFTDLETYILPNHITYTLVATGLVFSFMESNSIDSLLGLAIGFSFFLA